MILLAGIVANVECSVPFYLLIFFQLLAIATYAAVHFSSLRKRREIFAALAQKYNMHEGHESVGVPDPGVTGYGMATYYTKLFTGHSGGISVTAYDYRLGAGRGSVEGSGVGVSRSSIDIGEVRAKIRSNLHVTSANGWTYIYGIPLRGPLLTRRLKGTDMDGLLSILLTAPVIDCAVDSNATVDRALLNEIHLKPWRASSP